IVTIKPNIYHDFSIEDIMQSFNNSIGMPSGPSRNQFDQLSEQRNISDLMNIGNDPQDKRLEQLEKEYAEKDVQFKKEQRKAEENRMKILAVAQKAQEEGTLAKEQVYKLAQAQKQIDEEYKKKREEDRKEINNAKNLLLQ